MSGNNQNHEKPVTLREIIQMMAVMNPSPAPVAVVAPAVDRDGDAGVTKLIVGGIVVLIGVIMLGVFGWVGSSVNGLNTTVTKMSANVDQLQKSIADLQQTQGTATQQLSDIRTQNARQDARADAVEADLKRMKERIRMAEGQRPLTGDTGDL
ncbi:hypothetical protein C8J42_102513 [Sphingomonas sp. PP-CE-1A-559]|uniref:hypothetical protein n=1 Tax=Sphingomonas sp. PP-CE-1A-559 TaxID=2135657 RepID=UPI0010557659|nr:hypothetical protein [Sphingomonas sp. PP-CE-1A-559]TCP92737.1 hypothetical protein C8J42_102513 [Sphingomonas sp. PP-CE-1A-559]